MNNLKSFIKKTIDLYVKNRLPTAAAGLAYYLSMTALPIVIVIFAILGKNYVAAQSALDTFKSLLSDNVYTLVSSYLLRLSESYSMFMLYSAVSIIVVTASAGVRSFYLQVSKLQGYQRLKGVPMILSSVAAAFLIVGELLISIILISLGGKLIGKLLLLIEVHVDRLYIHYIILFFVTVVILMIIYNSPQKKDCKYPTLLGAFLAGAGLATLTWVFSLLMNVNPKYNLIYGSLAGVILILLWLYIACQIVYIGALINIARRDLAKTE